ncbi:MAG: hypothetical protein H6707_02695 [Deltaproteobacteria bacterium]|nr:hypothetical protein [Deltaproteobacteria bacterium]
MRVWITTLLITLIALPVWAQPQPQPQRKPPSRAALRKLRLQFEHEPSVQEAQQAALRFFKVDPGRVNTYRNGAEWKALMPELQANFNYNRATANRRLIDMIYFENPRFREGKDFEDTKNSGYSVGVQAHWSLDRLVFNAETLDVSSLVGVQEGLLREITSLYFTRRRLLTIFALNPPQDPGEQITESIRLDEITANIDALTGGWFGTQLKKVKSGDR